MDRAAAAFFLPSSGDFLIGVEHLSPRGIDPAYAETLRAAERVDEAWIACFNAAFSRAYARTEALWKQSSRYAFPPRLNNVVILGHHERANPYVRALSWSSWTLYRDDFDPERSSVELAAFLLQQSERLNLYQGDVSRSLVANLVFLLGLGEAELADLARGCRQTQRPDAAAWRALEEALPWLARVGHLGLRPGAEDPDDPCAVSEESGLVVPQSLLPSLAGLAEAAREAALTSVRASYAARRGAGDPEQLAGWLAEAAPELALVGPGGKVLWDYRQPDQQTALRPLLSEASAEALASLRSDLELVHQHSRRFLDAVQDPGALPRCSDEVSQEGGTYLHTDLGRIAFDLSQQPTWAPLHEPAPPFQRLLLGARVVHEFGHLADEAGLLGLLPGREAERERALEQWSASFGRIVHRFPGALQDRAREQVGCGPRADLGRALVDFTLTRFPDFVANLVLQAFAEPAELEAYVRVNARSHREEGLGPCELLSRYVHEYQYLRLSRLVSDPFAYFVAVTGIERLFCDTGLLQLSQLEELFGDMARVCDCYGFHEGLEVPGL